MKGTGAAQRAAQRLRAYLRSYSPLALQSITLALVCPVLIHALINSSAFAAERHAVMYGCSVVFVLFGIEAVIRRRVTAVSFWLQSLEAFTMIVLIGSSTLSLGVIAVCVSAVPTVLISAAAFRTKVETLTLIPLATVALGIMLSERGVSGVTLVLSCCGIASVAGCGPLIVFAFRTRAEQATATAERLARTDPLTGLLNRHGLAIAASSLVNLSQSVARPLGVLLVDVDHFKLVNDVHGHAAGDQVLQVLAKTVEGACQRGEAVARIGGEEICVLAVCDEPQYLNELAESIRARVEKAPTHPSVTVSIGGVFDHLPTTGAQAVVDSDDLVLRLLDRADTALYDVKRAGRNGVLILAPAPAPAGHDKCRVKNRRDLQPATTTEPDDRFT